MSITKHASSATRMVLDSLRTMVIWGVSLALKWESFCAVQIAGELRRGAGRLPGGAAAGAFVGWMAFLSR